MPVLTAEERLGQVLNDKYRVDRVLGQGGMEVVFAAEHTWTGRPVAVKMLHPELAREQPLVQRFFREARAAASLKPPNVIDVLDMGSTPDGAVYLVLEFLEGEALSARLEREGRLEPAEAAALLLPVMDALERAHQGGIVHRDLKPDNVFCTRVDVPGAVRSKLLDFGIAKDNAEQRVTATGHAMGTPAYMPPEQLSSAAHVTASADVWSMGVIWYEVLSGALPFEGESLPLLTVAIMTTKPRPLCARVPALPEALGAAVDRALERSTSQRWA